MSEHHGVRVRRRKTSATKVDLVIVIAGLVMAAASSVLAYRAVGPFGDGPLTAGLRRTQDPETGAQLVYRDVPKADGTVLRYLFHDSNRRLSQIQVRRVVDGKLEIVGLHVGANGVTRIDAGGGTLERDPGGGARIGFSLRGNGVIDAWEYRDAAGALVKIAVSRRQDGVVDRWEYYEADQLARVEEDENRDGRPDRWLTYQAGILVSESRDRNGDGRPD